MTFFYAVARCQLFHLKDYSSRSAEQNVFKLGVKHNWGKGNQFCINEGDGSPGARVVGPTVEIEVFILKDYSSRTAEQNVTKFCLKHHWEKGNQYNNQYK